MEEEVEDEDEVFLEPIDVAILIFSLFFSPLMQIKLAYEKAIMKVIECG